MTTKEKLWVAVAILMMVGCVLAILQLSGLVAFRHHSNELYRNYKCTIQSMSTTNGSDGSKFNNTVAIKTVLFRSLSDSTLYVEMTSTYWQSPITNEWWYNHKVGDTVVFTVIRKDHFFYITRH